MSTSLLQLFQTAFMQSWNSIVITDADIPGGCRVQIANEAFCRQTGYTLEELRGQTLKMLQGPETDPAVIEDLRACLREARFFEGTTTNYRKDGSSYIVRWNISPVRNEHGEVTHFLSVQQDISSLVQTERENMLYARALDSTSDPVVLTDALARILFVNKAFSEVTGYGPEEVRGRTPALLKSGAHDEAFYTGLYHALSRGEDFRATFVNKRRDGSLYHAEQSISPILDEQGRVTHYVSVSKDISKRVDMELALREAATRDQLTGLFNRRRGAQLLEELHQRAGALGCPLVVIMCDIDHFKRVNDQFGHPAGDRILANVARILKQAVRSSDAVIRWGGEEFLVLLESCPQGVATELAGRIRCRLASFEDNQVGKVTLSLGLARLRPEESVEQLIARADAALYNAKRGGRDQLVIAD